MAPVRAAQEVGELVVECLCHRRVTIVPAASRSLATPAGGGISLASRAQPQPIRRATCFQRGTPLVASTASTLHAPTAVALVAA